jgi:hypothetical protein
MPGYQYGITNKYRPSRLVKNAYGWTGSPGYNRADVPTALLQQPSGITADQFLQQFAYEWFQTGDIANSLTKFGGTGFSNPPFIGGAAGRLIPSLRSADGGVPRILRGYIRRAQFEAGDDASRSRLYFMYNPETITRDYVSYLEQGALDPFNTVYQSGNLVAPPSVLDFNFELFFDRQEEAQQVDHPGVYVDYQYFDLVVRNVVPSATDQTSNTLPDNGVMMVNPRDITVVFSPQFTVQGRPLNAQVSFEKFTHRMVPTRMRIALTMRAVYIGPVKDMSEYKAEQFKAEEAVPLNEIAAPAYIWNMIQLDDARANTGFDPTTGVGSGGGGGSSGSNNSGQADYNNQTGLAGDANQKSRYDALKMAIASTTGGTTYSGAGAGAGRYNLPVSADCSGLVTECYNRIGLGEAMGWTGHPGTDVIYSQFQANKWKNAQFIPLSADMWNQLDFGDLLFRHSTSSKQGHIKFFVGLNGNTVHGFAANSHTSNPQVGDTFSSIASHSDYLGAIRPMPHGQDMSANANPSGSSSSGRW